MDYDNKIDFIARYRECDKKPQSLQEHLNNVSKTTSKFASKVNLESTGYLLGLLHDAGKASIEFLEYIQHANGLGTTTSKNKNGTKLDHSTAGAQIIYNAFSNSDGGTTLTADMLAAIVASHHGFLDILTPDGIDALGKRLSKDEMETRKKQVLQSLPKEIIADLKSLSKSNINAEVLNALGNSFGDDYEVTEKNFSAGLLVRFLLSCLIDADRLDAADHESPKNKNTRQYGDFVNWSELIVRFEKHINSFEIKSEIDYLRREISEKCLKMSEQDKGFFRLTVPTGTGKTLASLRFALHHAEHHALERIIYVIPYTSIIDQNAKSIRKALGVDYFDSNIVLEHHSNLVPDKDNKKTTKEEHETEEDYEYRHRLLAENWDSPIVLTTMVQFLESLYGGGTNSCRRMHQLANSVVIFDEIQTLPIRMIHLFNLAVKFLVNACNSSILLCTATQPILHAIKPMNRSLPHDSKREIQVTSKQKQKTLGRVQILDYTRPAGWDHDEVANLSLEECDLQKSVLVIVNTKKDAREIYHRLSQQKQVYVQHLSTNMCSAHRLQKLDKIRELLNQEKPFILVSTQLIEAGVDVDFDVVIRSLAGIDSIAQAAGRCNRSGIKPYKGRVILVNSNTENLTMLPEISIGKEKTLRMLIEFKDDKEDYFQSHLLSDPSLERYFQYLFYEKEGEMNYPVSSRTLVGRTDNLVDLLGCNQKSFHAYSTQNSQNGKLNRILRQSFKTAGRIFEVIPQTGQGVIVPFGEGIEIIAELTGIDNPNKQFETLRKAQRFSVNCFTHEIIKLGNADAIREVQEGSGILCLAEGFYHDDLGWTYDKSTKLAILNR